MIIIHTILAHGECLMPKVIEGVLNQSVDCCLMPITSERDWKFHRRKNMIENWKEAYHYYDGDIFIGMDSDVVLSDPKTIEILLDKIKDRDIVTIATKPTHRDLFHSLFAVRTDSLEFGKDFKSCPICFAVDKAKRDGKNVECISDTSVEECARIYVRRKP